MKKCEIVKSNREFDKIIESNSFIKNKEFIIYYKDNSNEQSHFGISVGKKIGCAVERNYYKRIIRNICDNNKKLYSKGKDYIIILRKGAKELSFKEIEESFLKLMLKINEKERKKYNE